MSRGHRHRQSRMLRAAVDEARRRAAATAQAEAARDRAEVADALNHIALHLHWLPDADNTDRANDLLVNLAWCIGLGAAVAHSAMPGTPAARRLHGALRTVQSLCLSGYTWRSVHAHALEAAAREANALTDAHQDLAKLHAPEANYLAGRVQRREVTADDVAGAELYRKGDASTDGEGASQVQAPARSSPLDPDA